ncbi:hypothetical protein P691DRAFT_800356 [Macrolepiota fuliginosa MF-IS2]|uniref:Secreted protein n=1 Tax=Macrolepiota fuliginosa MF-IS2 TaxID=1400762 RepID=A0A9P5XDK8_9AGAR|nr:hypothetical protein P691DRAFT_800356 [Macrolepiota fuliginosa MF-IS2]
MTPQFILIFLAYWASWAFAIPFQPLVGPEYALSLLGNPPIKTFWAQLWNGEFPKSKPSFEGDDENTLPRTPPWHDPRRNGGRMLDFTTKRYGEPLNVVISGHSDPFVLTEEGLHAYAKSLGFSEECLGLHYGALHEANLGDGDERKTEQYLARQYYFPIWGTCWESLAGGHHFRAWKQNGTLANSGAWFIGASKEYDSGRHHRIVPNGYNLGRDYIVQRASSGGSWKGMSWRTDVEWRSDLLEAGSEGVNHGIEQDGRVAILTAHRIP